MLKEEKNPKVFFWLQVFQRKFCPGNRRKYIYVYIFIYIHTRTRTHTQNKKVNSLMVPRTVSLPGHESRFVRSGRANNSVHLATVSGRKRRKKKTSKNHKRNKKRKKTTTNRRPPEQRLRAAFFLVAARRIK